MKAKQIYILISGIAVLAFAYVLINGLYYNFQNEDEIPLPRSFVVHSKDGNISPAEQGGVRVAQAASASTPTAHYPTDPDSPARILIPAIGVNAKIEEVGLTLSGRMAVPAYYSDVGWWKYGPKPGERGSAVLAGHVNDGFALPEVFARLGDLNKGDNISVQTVDGKTIHFIVSDIEVYPYDAIVPQIFNQTDGSYLKLITCTGVWVDAAHTHNERLVVTAVKTN